MIFMLCNITSVETYVFLLINVKMSESEIFFSSKSCLISFKKPVSKSCLIFLKKPVSQCRRVKSFFQVKVVSFPYRNQFFIHIFVPQVCF